MGRDAMGQLQKGAKERLVDFGPFCHLPKVITAREHATEAQDDKVNQGMFEILPWAAGIGDSLKPLHEGTRLRSHPHSFRPGENCGTPVLLTPSLYRV